MKRCWRRLLWVGLAMALAGCGRPPETVDSAPREVVEAQHDLLVVATSFAGTLESRHAQPLASRLSQPATIVELIPEGTLVAAGERLVRFDPGGLERELIALEREERLAQAQWRGLERGELPLKRAEVEGVLADAEWAHAEALAVLAETEALFAEALVPETELRQQERRARQAAARLEAARLQRQVTRDEILPAALARAEAARDAAVRELALLRAERDQCELTAPAAGVVVHTPLHVGGEYRAVRVGDTVYRHQPFLLVADMGDLVARCMVPEAELSRVTPGASAEITPQAFPELRIPAEVATIGSMAQTLPGQPAWQKYFPVTLRLAHGDGRLRSGMTVQARIESARREEALLLPRRAVRWTESGPVCRVDLGGGRTRETPVVLGLADAARVEIREGLEPGQRVVVP